MAHRLSLRPIGLATLLVSLATRVLSQQCYYPDGNAAPTVDVPCNASAVASPCCNKGALCLENGLCMGGGVISRGSCTDRNWGGDCTEWCRPVNNNTGVALFPCSPFGNLFSCDWGSCDNTFAIDGASAIVLRDDQVKPLGTPYAMVLSPTDVLSAASLTATGSSNSTMSQTAAPSDSSAKYTSGDMAAVGAGIGVPLLLALLGAIFLLLRKQRPHKDESQPLAPESHPAIPHSYQPQAAPAEPLIQYGQAEKSGGSNTYLSYGSHYVGELDGGRETQELSGHQNSEMYSSPR